MNLLSIYSDHVVQTLTQHVGKEDSDFKTAWTTSQQTSVSSEKEFSLVEASKRNFQLKQ